MNHNKILRFLGIALLVIAVWLTALTTMLGSPILVIAFLFALLFLVFFISIELFFLLFVFEVKE